MSQIPITVQTDLSQVLAEINQKLDNVQKNVTDLRIGQGEIKGRLVSVEKNSKKIPDLAEKVGELKNWKQIGVIVITAMISAMFSGTIGGVIGWLIRRGKV